MAGGAEGHVVAVAAVGLGAVELRGRLDRQKAFVIERRQGLVAVQGEHHHPRLVHRPARGAGNAAHQQRIDAALAHFHGDVLLAVDGVADGRGHDRALQRGAEQVLAGACVVRVKIAGSEPLEHQATAGGEHAAVPRALVVDAEHFLLRDRIPGRQPALQGLGHFGLDLGVVRQADFGHVQAQVEAHRVQLRVVAGHVAEWNLLGRDIDQAGLRAVGHGLPVVATQIARQAQPWFAGQGIQRIRHGVGAAGLGVQAGGPVDRHVGFAGQEFTGGRVQHVEEAVLGRMQDHVALLARHRDVGGDDVLGGGEIPLVLRGFLEVPHVLAGLRAHGDDTAQEQIVAHPFGAQLVVPWRAVADADVQQVGDRVVGHGVPHRAAATGLLPGAVGAPGLVGQFAQGLVGDGPIGLVVRRRHRVEAPLERPRLSIKTGDKTTGAHFRAAVADHHHALGHPGRGVDGVALDVAQVRIVGDGIDAPGHLAGLVVQGDEAGVEGAEDDLAVPVGRATVDRVAAAAGGHITRHLGVIGPQQLAGGGVESLDLAPVGGPAPG